MPLILISEESLLPLIRAKSRISAEALYDQYAVIFRLVIFRIVLDIELTDIVLEKTICRIWNTADQFNEREVTLLTWMLPLPKI